jgi:hypothetical protein
MSIFFLQQAPIQGGKILLFLIFLIILIALFVKSTSKTSSTKNISFSSLRKFNTYSRKTQLGIIFLFLMVLGSIFKVSGVGKPSICDCEKISLKELNGTPTGKWYDCVKSYEKEIREYGRNNGQNYVNIVDEGHLYFNQNCND